MSRSNLIVLCLSLAFLPACVISVNAEASKSPSSGSKSSKSSNAKKAKSSKATEPKKTTKAVDDEYEAEPDEGAPTRTALGEEEPDGREELGDPGREELGDPGRKPLGEEPVSGPTTPSSVAPSKATPATEYVAPK